MFTSRPLRLAALGAALLVAAPWPRVAAQVVPVDTVTRVPGPRGDTTIVRGPRQTRAGAAPRPGLRPPVTPRRAFLSSALLPGLGQSRLGRPTAGAVFAAVEMGAIVMIGRSLGDLRAAKAFRADSVPATQPVDAQGVAITPTTQTRAPFTNELVRARRLHLEDWISALLFNHLISGAEAYVSANLYDLPAQLSARPTSHGGALAVTLAW